MKTEVLDVVSVRDIPDEVLAQLDEIRASLDNETSMEDEQKEFIRGKIDEVRGMAMLMSAVDGDDVYFVLNIDDITVIYNGVYMYKVQGFGDMRFTMRDNPLYKVAINPRTHELAQRAIEAYASAMSEHDHPEI